MLSIKERSSLFGILTGVLIFLGYAAWDYYSAPPKSPTNHAGINYAYALATITIINQPDAKASASKPVNNPAQAKPEAVDATPASAKPKMLYLFGAGCKPCARFERDLGKFVIENYELTKQHAQQYTKVPRFVLNGYTLTGYKNRADFVDWLNYPMTRKARK